jgi:hypothetical protein
VVERLDRDAGELRELSYPQGVGHAKFEVQSTKFKGTDFSTLHFAL